MRETAHIETVDICGCTNEQLEAGRTCGQDICPNRADPTDPAPFAAAILAEIHNDMRERFPWGKQIPRNVGTFGHLHDYCDANCYLIDLVSDPVPVPSCDCDMSAQVPSLYEAGKMLADHTEQCAINSAAYEAAMDARAALDNAVADLVNRRLGVEACVLSGQLASGVTLDADDGVIDYELLDTQREEGGAAWWHDHHEGPVCHPLPGTCDHDSCAQIITEACVACILAAESAELDKLAATQRAGKGEPWVTVTETRVTTPAALAAEQRVTVVVTHPDAEACEASRITGVEVMPGEPALDLAVNQEAFTAEIGRPGNAVHVAPPSAAETVCAGCGDYIHGGSDGRLFDSSGDPECWAFENGPHRIRSEQQPLQRWISEFGPGYDVPGAILAEPGLLDVSWHNDACPAFGRNEHDYDYVIWVEHPDPARRELPFGRFSVTTANGETSLYEGDDVEAALAAYRQAVAS